MSGNGFFFAKKIKKFKIPQNPYLRLIIAFGNCFIFFFMKGNTVGGSGESMGESTERQDLYDCEELAGYLNIKVDTLRHWVMQDKIPYFKVGICVRFSKRRIEEWLEEHARGPQKVRAPRGKKNSGGGEYLPFAGEGVRQ
jgi:excisionase family DNA binding protein